MRAKLMHLWIQASLFLHLGLLLGLLLAPLLASTSLLSLFLFVLLLLIWSEENGVNCEGCLSTQFAMGFPCVYQYLC